ncbi:MAG: hypothetical protein FMNOHCHN_02971 [Ignavibacteriaceae bacterium]|nr:hypothetical protein [Ignavibacteriaceae bacterium]
MKSKTYLFLVPLAVFIFSALLTGCSGMDSTTREEENKQPVDSVYVFDVQEEEVTREEKETPDPEEKNDSLITYVRDTSVNAKTVYAVQVGAFSSEANAKKHIETSEKLLGKKLRTFYSTEVKFWVVQLMPVAKSDEAHKIKRSIRKKKEFKDAFVVKVIE